MKTPQKETYQQSIIPEPIDLLTKYFKKSQSSQIPPFPLILKNTPYEEILHEFKAYQEYHQSQSQKELATKDLIIKTLEEKLSEQNMFMLNIAQNILNPLNGILGFVDLMVNEEEKLSLNEKKRYLNFIIRAENSLVQYVDYISDYTKIMNNQEEANGACRTKHLINRVEQNISNHICAKYNLDDTIQIEILNKNSDYFIQLPEHLLEIIWEVLIEYLVSLMKKGKLKIQATKKAQKLQLFTSFNSDEYLNKTTINLITRYLDKDPRAVIKQPRFGIPAFIAKKHLDFLNGSIDFKVIDSKNIQFLIEFPIQECE